MQGQSLIQGVAGVGHIGGGPDGPKGGDGAHGVQPVEDRPQPVRLDLRPQIGRSLACAGGREDEIPEAAKVRIAEFEGREFLRLLDCEVRVVANQQ